MADMHNPCKNYTDDGHRKTRAAVKDAARRMLARKASGMITVKELCDKAKVSRASFYNCYGNIDGLVSEIEDDLVQGLLRVVPDEAGNLGSWCMEPSAMAFIRSEKGIFRSFLVRNENLRFISKWKAGLKSMIEDRIPQDGLERLLLDVASSYIVTAYTMWLDDPDGTFDINAVKTRLSEIGAIF